MRTGKMGLMQSRTRRAAAVRFVLVEPRDSRNVGAACRAMKTMGFRSLYLVGASGIDLRQAAVTAVHAADLLQEAVFCRELGEAIEGVALAAAVSRRRGRWRKYFALGPGELAQRVASLREGTCAVVFGNESAGLSDRDLRLCHVAVRIPSAPDFPSLNLSHAVQLLAYELFQRLGEKGPAFRPVDGKRLDALVAQIIGALRCIGYFTRGDPGELGMFWRDILARAALEHREAERLGEIFAKISGMVAGRPIDP